VARYAAGHKEGQDVIQRRWLFLFDLHAWFLLSCWLELDAVQRHTVPLPLTMQI